MRFVTSGAAKGIISPRVYNERLDAGYEGQWNVNIVRLEALRYRQLPYSPPFA